MRSVDSACSRRISRVLSAALALFLAACNGSDYHSPTAAPPPPPQAAPAPPAADLSGVWAGTYTSLADGFDQLTDGPAIPTAASIEQTDGTVTCWLGTSLPVAPGSVYKFEATMEGANLYGWIDSFRAFGHLEGRRLTIVWVHNRWDLQR